MKIYKTAVLLIVVALIASCNPKTTAIKESSRVISVQKLLESRRYQFIPRSVQTPRGRNLQISNYSLVLRGDTLVSYLPYYGIAYSAEIGTNKGPLDFTTTGFEYSREDHKKGNTIIHMKLDNQVPDARDLFLNVSSTGYASLNVRFNNRQAISFSGEIRGIR
jgi:hypothetical protein